MKHVLRTWVKDGDETCTCIEVFDDVEGEIIYYEIPNNGKKVFVKA